MPKETRRPPRSAGKKPTVLPPAGPAGMRQIVKNSVDHGDQYGIRPRFYPPGPAVQMPEATKKDREKTASRTGRDHVL
jgi:hypothetical protein